MHTADPAASSSPTTTTCRMIKPMANMHPPRRRASGQLEGETLATLWSADHPMTPAEVQRALGGELAYTTVMTILTRLYDKGLAQRVPLRRGYGSGGATASPFAPTRDEPGRHRVADRIMVPLAVLE